MLDKFKESPEEMCRDALEDSAWAPFSVVETSATLVDSVLYTNSKSEVPLALEKYFRPC